MKRDKDERDPSERPGPQYPDASSGGSNASTPPVRTADSGGATFDVRSARIERQHSQEMAIRVLAETLATQVSVPEYKTGLKQWTDYFCDDLDDYERARKGQPPKVKEPDLSNFNPPDGDYEDDERPPLSDDDAPPLDTGPGDENFRNESPYNNDIPF